MPKILQSNVLSYFNNHHLIATLLKEEQPDVVKLNSTCITNGHKIKHYGVATLIHNTIEYECLITSWQF